MDPITFGPFRFEPSTLQLWKDELVIAVQPKPLAVLRFLVARPGQVVTKQALLKEVWAGTYVTQAVLKVAVRALREALGESADAARYIQTEGREGYRFIGSADEENQKAKIELFSLASNLVGREAELAHLHTLLEKALRGEPQFVFVTGEPGIGKTTLIGAFLHSLKSKVQSPRFPNTDPRSLPPDPWLAHGQCIEQYGQGEPYLLVLEALGRLCREAGGQDVITLLRKYAPTWLVQLSGVMDEAETHAFHLQVPATTPQRMLREIAEALAVGTASRPLLLVLEDLHWSDQATGELLSYLAQRRDRARLMIIGTYRPTDLVVGNHPLKGIKQELHAKRLSEELRVELLSRQEISAYLNRRFPHHQFPVSLPEEIHRRTEGNALFVVNMVEDLLHQGRIVEEQGHWMLTDDLTQVKTPDTLRQLIEKQIAQRSDGEQQLLEVASVGGTEFAVAVLAAALKQDIDEVEETCEDLAGRGHFLEEWGISEWPDGTISGRYGFRHTLYQKVLYERMTEARKVRLHRLIGEQLETGHGEKAHNLAAELAVHFERGRDYRRAVHYLRHAGENALRKSAHQEDIAHLTQGLALLKTLAPTPEEARQELALREALGPALIATKGYAASEAEAHFTQLGTLLSGSRSKKGVGVSFEQMITKSSSPLQRLLQSGIRRIGFPTLIGLAAYYLSRGELRTSQKLGARGLRLAERARDSALLLAAHVLLGIVLFYRGKFTAAQAHLETVNTHYDPEEHHAMAYRYAYDPGVTSLSMTSISLVLVGYPERARHEIQATLTLARQLSHPFSLSFALGSLAIGYQFLREDGAAREKAETLMALAGKHTFPLWSAIGIILHGWTLVEQGQEEEGIGRLCKGLSDRRAMKAAAGQTYYLSLLAGAYEKIGRSEEGLAVLAEALEIGRKHQESVCEAELHRLKGELILQQSKASPRQVSDKSQPGQRQSHDPNRQAATEAEACFFKAITIARGQRAKWWELRATVSLARLWQQQGKKQQAHEKLAEIYNWFTEGFDTKDLQEARALLEELGQ